MIDLDTLRRGCCWLLLALGLAVNVPRADAAGPGLLDYFRACGIGDDAFARFADDRQIADEELDVIRRIAVRLRDCPADRLQHDAARDRPMAITRRRQSGDRRKASLARGGQGPAWADVRTPRFRRVRGIRGGPGGEPLWRCTVTLSEYPHRAVVYVAEVPEKLRAGSAGQRVAAGRGLREICARDRGRADGGHRGPAAAMACGVAFGEPGNGFWAVGRDSATIPR